MSSYVLDLVVHEADISDDASRLKSDVFLEFKLDGLSETFNVQPCPSAPHIKWDFPVRLILHVSEFSRSFMFASLCTLGAGQKIIVGRARFPLKSLPVGNPKRFKFPLMSSANNAICVATVHVTACLSALVPYHSTQEVGARVGGAPGRGQYWSAPA
jgi:hypothetical protein